MKKQILMLTAVMALGITPFASLPVRAGSFQISALAENKADGFSINVPSGWTSKPLGDGSIMAYFAPPKDGFAVNFNARTMKDSGSPLNTLGPYLKKQYPSQFKNWKAYSDGLTKLKGGDQAYWLSGMFTLEGIQIQNVQYFIRGKKQMYIVTFTCLPKDFTKQQSTFHKMADSIKTS